MEGSNWNLIPNISVDIHVLLQAQWGGQGDQWRRQEDPAPHNHGDTNIHYRFVVTRTHAFHVPMG